MNNMDKYLEMAKTNELAADLRKKGYEVKTEAHLGDLRFDILAQKGQEKVAYDISVRSKLAEEKEHVTELRQHAKLHGYEFRLITIIPPHRVDIYIEDLEDTLLTYLVNEETPDDLLELSSNTLIDGVCDLEYDTIQIQSDVILLQGSGVVEVELQYGKEQGDSIYDSYPFVFHIELDHKMQIQDCQITVDTTSFYDDGTE